MGVLDVFYAAALTLAGLWCAWKADFFSDPLNGFGMGAAMLAFTVMMLFGWSTLGSLYDFLYMALPQRGSNAHQISVCLLVVVALSSYVVLMSAGPSLVRASKQST